ncbi:MAG: hypothetical protein E6L05_04485 [Thaumarchaeota archaeon]|nr:MAG: hypothetical protein E6L05_04485 [Nitrososphaerota archaeon]
MKYYGPVKTALVIIPPENLPNNGTQTKKETVLLKLRQYLASFAAFVVGAYGIYVAEKSQGSEITTSVPQMAAKNMQHGQESLNAVAPTAPSVATTPSLATVPTVTEPSVLSSEPIMILIAILGGVTIFCAMFFGTRFYLRRKKIKKLN